MLKISAAFSQAFSICVQAEKVLSAGPSSTPPFPYVTQPCALAQKPIRALSFFLEKFTMKPSSASAKDVLVRIRNCIVAVFEILQLTLLSIHDLCHQHFYIYSFLPKNKLALTLLPFQVESLDQIDPRDPFSPRGAGGTKRSSNSRERTGPPPRRRFFLSFVSQSYDKEALIPSRSIRAQRWAEKGGALVQFR